MTSSPPALAAATSSAVSGLLRVTSDIVALQGRRAQPGTTLAPQSAKAGGASTSVLRVSQPFWVSRAPRLASLSTHTRSVPRASPVHCARSQQCSPESADLPEVTPLETFRRSACG
jgi:hypothetical protein